MMDCRTIKEISVQGLSLTDEGYLAIINIKGANVLGSKCPATLSVLGGCSPFIQISTCICSTSQI